MSSKPPHRPSQAFCSATKIGAKIGVGSFKEVHRATLRLPGRGSEAMDVAVLKIRVGSVATEADTLMKLGRHPYLVNFIGQCMDGPNDVLLVTEFAPLGDLESYIEDLDEDGVAISFEHKCAMLRQVSAGMQAVAGAGLIHRDVACRNILVFAFEAGDAAKTVVKVSAFGLAVNGHTAKHRYAQDDDAKPTRYLAPEALERGRYSEHSDVWSFGVLAWELLTDGRQPYFQLTNDSDVVLHVTGGGRLPRPMPEQCPSDELWSTIESCWMTERKARPVRNWEPPLPGENMLEDTDADGVACSRLFLLMCALFR